MGMSSGENDRHQMCYALAREQLRQSRASLFSARRAGINNEVLILMEHDVVKSEQRLTEQELLTPDAI